MSGKDSRRLRESDLYEPVRTFLEGMGFTVQAEVVG